MPVMRAERAMVAGQTNGVRRTVERQSSGRVPAEMISPVDLNEFVEESLDRPAIAAFMREVAGSIAVDARLLDAGSGVGPYRPLFAHARYVSTDWENSPHAGDVDVVASLLALPF